MAKKKDLNITSKEIQDFFRATGKSPSGSPLEQGLINIYPEAALISNPFKGVVTSSPLGISLGKKAAVKTIRALDPIYRASETLNKGIYDTAKKGYKKVYDYTLERTPEEYKSTVGKAFKDTWKTLNSENVIPLYPALFNPNNYADGGSLLNKLGKWNTAATSKLMGSSFGQGLDKLGISQDNLGGIANTAVSTISGFMNPSGNQTGIGNTMQTIGGIASNIPGVGGLIGAGVNLLGGLTNAAFGSNINEEFVDQTKEDIKNQSNYISEASTNAELLADFSTHRDLANVTKDQVGTEGWFSSKASRITNQLNKDIDKANTRAWMSLGNTAFNVDKMNDLMAMQNISAYGGPIHIKKENRGKFTDYCGGKVTNECIQKGLNSPNPLTRKRANFARNARGWSHADGGILDTNFSNGINIIGNGETHEQNNLGGVQMGVDQNGIPNLVEEGEVIWNNYVFSNRLKVPKDMREKYKLHKDITFANAAKKLQKESEERPNDPISKRGLDALMQDIMTSQEGVRQQSNNTSSNKFAEGGPVRDSRWDFTPTILPDKIEPFSAYGLTFGNKKPFTKGQGDLYTRNMRNYGKTINGQGIKDSWLRKLPIGMAGTSVISDIFSKPDYSAADRIANVDLNPSLVGFNPIGQRLTYKPMDVDYRTNQLLSKSAATDRNILNTSGGNRAAAMAGLLASEYNTQLGLSELARQADEYNRAQEERVAGFNRQTDLSNSQMGLQAAMANQQARNNATQLRLNQADRVAMLRQAAKDRYDARRSNNMNLLIQGLADLGREETQRNWLDWLGEKGVLKVDSKGNITTGDTKACGGKLRTRKKKGYTYG